MKLGIISDTHDHLDNLRQAINYLKKKQVDALYHCGDWNAPFTFSIMFEKMKPNMPVYGVLGNNEGDRYSIKMFIDSKNWNLKLNPDLITDSKDGLKIALYHGHDQKVLESLICSKKYDVVFSGHTHRSSINKINNVIHINPGKITDWPQKSNPPTLAIFDTETKQAKIHQFKQ